MKLKNLSVFIFFLITFTYALELQVQSKTSRTCCTGSCLRRCVKKSRSISRCLKPCKARINKTKMRTISRTLRRTLLRSRGRGRYSRRHVRRFGRRNRNLVSRRGIRRNRRYVRSRFQRRRGRYIRRYSRRRTHRRIKLSLRKFITRRQYYLTTYYWPHWHNYYSAYHYYPYYHFYWFFYGHYQVYYPFYYSYYFHYLPTVHHYHVSNVVYLSHGHPIVLLKTALPTVVVKQYNIVRCAKGPKFLLRVNYKGKTFRIFLGDVNDFTNLGCLYFMDSIVSVGKTNFVNRVNKLYKTQKRTLKVKGKKITVSPFSKNPFTPSKTNLKKVNRNASVLRFTLNRKNSNKKFKKSLLFYHLYNSQIQEGKHANKIFKGLAKQTKKSTTNVLFIADHLEPQSMFVLKYLLTAYKKMTVAQLVRVTYRRIRLFSGLILHYHHRYVVRHH